MSFCEMTGLMDERMDIVSVKIKKAFDTVSQDSFKDKLKRSELKRRMKSWTENWLNSRAQKN